MKSKSFDFKRSPVDKDKYNKKFDFVSLYKPAAENSNLMNKEDGDGIDKENSFAKPQKETPYRGSSPNKKKKKVKQELLDISTINIEGPSLEANMSKNSPFNQSRTSTPRTSNKDKSLVKSIMKNSTVVNDDTMSDGSQIQYNSKPKKRNKSVSFMLDDNEEVSPKKTKSEESLVTTKQKTPEKMKPVKLDKADISKEKKMKKPKKQSVEKGRAGATSMETESVETGGKNSNSAVNSSVDGPSNSESTKLDKKKKIKHIKKHKKTEATKKTEDRKEGHESNNNEEAIDNKNKKLNKKKRNEKFAQSTDAEAGEPAAKTRKKEVIPEVIAENLENLTIGDNPHTLTSLLDEMTVADKDKRKRNKRKLKKANGTTSKSVKTETDAETVKEKVKWTKKWNKAKKAEAGNNAAMSVIVENLPLSLICSYKKVLAEHFEKCGAIKRIGIAEVYPSEGNGFTTTIHFDSEAGATEALSENGTIIDGNKIQVKRPLPPTQTTIVVRSYALLSDQSICTAFSEHGRIRTIRRLVKGKKSMETVFIEFDGPEAVERAIELSKGAKVAGKKIYVAKFEVRKKKRVKAPEAAAPAAAGPSDGEADSEHSND